MATKSESKNRKGHGDVVKNVDVNDSSFSTRQNAEVVDESSSLEENNDDAALPATHDSIDGNFLSLPISFIVSILLEDVPLD